MNINRQTQRTLNRSQQLPRFDSISACFNPILRWLSAGFVLGLMLFVQGCDSTPDQTLVEQHIRSIAEAIEEKKASTVLDFIDDDFLSAEGKDKKWAKQMLAFHSLRNQKISTSITQINVTTDEQFDDVMHSEFTALLTGGQGLLPERGQVYRVKIWWRKKGGDWLITRAEWDKPLGGGGY